MAYKLLLADDSVTIQRVIELTFADEDAELTAVGDGAKAIERIDADPPDIVLADVGMPGKDGYEVAAHIKNTPRLAHIPVLLLTGAFEPIDEERARAVGCDGVLAKPFEPQMVITRVKELLADVARSAAKPRARLPLTFATSAPAAAPEPEAPAAAPATSEPVEPPSPADRILADLDALASRTGTPALAADAAGSAAPDDTPQAETGIELESALEAAIRIRRRPTMAVPELGAMPAEPQPAAEPSRPSAALDEYFERLDAAFANLHPAPAGPAPADDGAWSLPAVDDGRIGAVLPEETAPARASSDAARGWASARPADDASGGTAPAIAQAFSALLAAERGEGGGAPGPALFAQPVPPAVDLDELAARVTQRVLEQMTDRVVRDAVTDIVSRVAERLVREEIDRIKASLA